MSVLEKRLQGLEAKKTANARAAKTPFPKTTPCKGPKTGLFYSGRYPMQ
jgi:hypothetical protein